jgi:hypothetical protein
VRKVDKRDTVMDDRRKNKCNALADRPYVWRKTLLLYEEEFDTD